MDISESIQYLKSKAPLAPKVGIVCGSGLGDLASILADPLTVLYQDIPGFPVTTVQGHKGELVFGYVGAKKTPVVCLKGRFHSYEGHELSTCSIPGRLFHSLGCEIMLVTNAAGGINASFNVGDVMLMSDHIGFPTLAGKHPLVGPHDDKLGARFVAMSEAYDKNLRNLMIKVAKENNIPWLKRQGTYCMVSGPTYETAAESEMLRRSGVDAVGMSTVPEVIAAVQSGLKVIGMSLITNAVALPSRSVKKATHEEVLETVEMRGRDLCVLVEEFLNRIDESANITEPIDENLIIEDIKSVDLSNTTPIEALNLINKWQTFLK